MILLFSPDPPAGNTEIFQAAPGSVLGQILKGLEEHAMIGI